MAYDGNEVKDNAKMAKVKIIDEKDRSSSYDAHKVFDSLFSKTLIVRIKDVYQLKPMK